MPAEQLVLIALLLIQQCYYMRQVQKLIDKLMSRSYHEYVGATKPPAPKVQLPLDPPEDLGVLGEFRV